MRRLLPSSVLALAVSGLVSACVQLPLPPGDAVLTPDRAEAPPAVTAEWDPKFFVQPWTTSPGREFLHGRRIAPNGSLAGPWIGPPLTAFLPVHHPSFPRGRSIAARLCADCEPGGGADALFNREQLLAAATGWNVPWIESFVRVTFGHGDFPAMRDHLTPIQIWDLIAYARVAVGPGLATLAATRELFVASCAMCHGSQGFGDGHEGYLLKPPSANFQQVERMLNRSDEQIYKAIRYGVFGSAMPPWKDILTAEQMRLLTFYVRSFNYTVDR